LELYDEALPQVFGYALSRCGDVALAEDITAEAFLAAATAVRAGTVDRLTVGWLVTVARNKLVDHWRARSREERRLRLVAGSDVEDGWDARLDAVVAHQVLAELAPQHRLVLTLRYLDGLAVPEIAEQMDRSVHATESLLARARSAFRDRYDGAGGAHRGGAA
jgi:RNA polymerase sigma-70 factor (ECF subfamily)